ncbi:adenylate kinase [Pseudoroseomonas wenyumeiae]
MRIVVIGISGAGKSTLAAQLAQDLGVPHVELDALYWEPGWTMASPAAFAARVEAATAGPAWVADGNYRAVRPLLWGRATHLVWLDYGRPVIMTRVIRRSLLRALSGRELWNGNREHWRNLLEPDHPIRYAWRQWAPRRRSWRRCWPVANIPIFPCCACAARPNCPLPARRCCGRPEAARASAPPAPAHGRWPGSSRAPACGCDGPRACPPGRR